MDAQDNANRAFLEQLGPAGITTAIGDQEFLIKRVICDKLIVKFIPAINPFARV